MKKKRVLFISPIFNGYHLLISEEMQKLNFDVKHFSDKPRSLLYRILGFFSPVLKKKIERYFLQSIIKNINYNYYDYVFIIKGTVINTKFLNEIKSILPKAKLLMYQWDSLKTHKGFKENLQFSIVSKFALLFCLFPILIVGNP